MRIAFLVDARVPCGIENHTFQLARGMRARGHAVRIFTSGDDLAVVRPLIEHPSFAGLEVTPAGVHGAQPAGSLFRRSFALARAVRAWRADVVHVQRGGPYTMKWPVLALWMRGGAPLVSTDHDQLYAAAWKRRLLRVFDPLVRRFIAVSDYAHEQLTRRYGRAERVVRRIHHGIDLVRYRPAEAGERERLRAELGMPAAATVIGFIGRLAPEKGVDLLLDAAAQVLPAAPDVVLTIAGGGPEEDALRARVQRLGLGERVRFLGFVRDAAEYYRTLDVLAMPSRYEAFGLVAAEAMASGVAVVAAPAGGLREVLGDGAAGRVVPVDDVVALAEALRELVTHPSQRAAVAAQGRARVRERHDQERMLDATEAVYTEVCGFSASPTSTVSASPATPSR